jgi:hypothetical protein
MDYKRLALAAVVAWVVDVFYGIGVWMLLLGDEFAKYPAVFRSEAAMNANLPLMFAGGLLAMFVLAYVYAKGYEGGNGIQEGLRFGALISLFTLGFVSLGLYGTFNIEGGLALRAAVASFFETIVVGMVIGALYRPAAQMKGTRAMVV